MVKMELKLNDEDMQKLVMELAKEMGDRFSKIRMKDYSPEKISEFRFVHSFNSVDQLIELYHNTPEYSFYNTLGVGVPGKKGTTFGKESPFKDERHDDYTSSLREFAVQFDTPFNLGLVYIPEDARHQDSFFERENQKFMVQNAQKTRNWRGNILTIILDQDLASTPHIAPSCYSNKDTIVASFKKDDEGLYVPDKYFLRGE